MLLTLIYAIHVASGKDLLSIKMNDASWLGFFQWLSIIAILISLIGAICSNYLETRVTNAMKSEIAHIYKQAAESNAIAANANKRTEELKAENLKLAVELERNRLARLEIERRVGPRYISPEEKETIISVLRPYAGQRIIIRVVSRDPEVQSFAADMNAALKGAGWQVTLDNSSVQQNPIPYGIRCLISKQPSDSVLAFLSTLKKLTIDFTEQRLVEATDIPDDYLIIHIGLKRSYSRN